MARKKSKPQGAPAAAPPPSPAAAPAVPAPAAFLARASRFGWMVAFFLGAGLFLPTLGYEFTYDDTLLIRDNLRIRDLSRPAEYLATSYWDRPNMNKEYRPAILLTYALNHAVGGLDPFGYRVVNVLLHGLVCAALWALVADLFGRRGLATGAAALFAIHPIHVEAVAGVVGRAELLASLGFLGGLVCATRSMRARDPERRWAWALAGGAPVAVAVFSKENALTLGPTMAAIPIFAALAGDRAGGGEPGGRIDAEGEGSARPAPFPARAAALFARLVPALAVAFVLHLAYLAARVAVLGGLRGDPYDNATVAFDNPLVEFGTVPRVLTAMKILGRYAALLLWPFHPSPDYSFGAFPLVQRLSDPTWMLGAALVPASGALAWALRRRPATLFGAALFVVTFALTSNVFFPIGTIMGERLLYLPSAGFCLVAADLGGEALARARRASSRSRAWAAGCAVAGLWLAAILAQTIRYTPVWRDNATLFEYMARAVPGSARARLTYGNQLLNDGRVEEAIAELEESVRIFGRLPASRIRLGTAYLRAGRFAKAKEMLEAALAQDPYDPQGVMNLARVYAMEGRRDDAEKLYPPAVQAHAYHYQLRLDYALLLEENGRRSNDPERLSRAVERFEEIRREARVADPKLLVALGRARAALGEKDAARAALTEALAANPTNAEAAELLGKL